MEIIIHLSLKSLFAQASLTEGCRLPVRMNGTDDWPLAEILSIKEHLTHRTFYVHYVDCAYTKSHGRLVGLLGWFLFVRKGTHLSIYHTQSNSFHF